MYLQGIRILDLINIAFSLFTAIILFTIQSIWLDGIMLIAAAILLWQTKYSHRKPLLFAAAFISTWYFASLLTRPLLVDTIHISQFDMHPLWIPVIAAGAGLAASQFRIGTSTLTLLWLALYLLAAVETLVHNKEYLLARYWTPSMLADTINQYIPVLIAALCIGIFLEKFQKALIIDYMSNK
ncbi:hypothetical protein [Peribacillus sp. SCS-37]|uniref:hypothetical protein n=1 Tax=Paraperibacillus esterisolvens TaxID=3115296 RepID=UPI003906D016